MVKRKEIFFREDGFTSAGMAVAILVSLSLVFASTQIYRIRSLSADIQDVADAAALAAENEVAQFMVAVRVSDAIVLSLTLSGVAVIGIGVAALCVPSTAPAGEKLIEAGKRFFRARDAYSEEAKEALDVYQKLLPFLAAANSMAVARKNSSDETSYVALSVLLPYTGMCINTVQNDDTDTLEAELDEKMEDLEAAAEKAEEAAEIALKAKERAFLHDCGSEGYCMYERAASLAGLEGSENPVYRSSDAWSFSVALNRAQAYYRARAEREAPADASMGERVRSMMRLRLYRYAVEELDQGYVREDGDGFESAFPLLPKNAEEFRETELYTESIYPVTEDGDGSYLLHALCGCPTAEAMGVCGNASLRDMETGGWKVCPSCGFSMRAAGEVAAASSSIENGFEYHYRIVAEAASEYQLAMKEAKPAKDEVKSLSESLFDLCKSIGGKAADARISAEPPGSNGVIVLVADVNSHSVDSLCSVPFVSGGASLGPRAAVSAARLLEDGSDDSAGVLAELLDDKVQQGSFGLDVADSALECWSACLGAYAEGQDAVSRGLEKLGDGMFFGSASGLGTWASEKFREGMEDLGLQPAELGVLRPVLANSGEIAAADDSLFAVRFLSVKQGALKASSTHTDVFGTVLSYAESQALDQISSFDKKIELATLQPLGDWGPSIPITIAIPAGLRKAAASLTSQVFSGLYGLAAEASGVRIWE